jgi:hypothetical protein
MEPVDFSCLLPPSSLMALETIRGSRWEHVHVAASLLASAPSTVRTGSLRIRGTADVVITAWPVDIVWKLEVIRLHAHIVGAGESPHPRFRGPPYQDAGEILSAFHASIPQILVGARRYEAPDWASDIRTILVEDLLILRHPSRQQVLIAPDEDLPGSLVVAREMDQIANSDAEIAYLRPI